MKRLSARAHGEDPGSGPVRSRAPAVRRREEQARVIQRLVTPEETPTSSGRPGLTRGGSSSEERRSKPQLELKMSPEPKGVQAPPAGRRRWEEKKRRGGKQKPRFGLSSFLVSLILFCPSPPNSRLGAESFWGQGLLEPILPTSSPSCLLLHSILVVSLPVCSTGGRSSPRDAPPAPHCSFSSMSLVQQSSCCSWSSCCSEKELCSRFSFKLQRS